MSELKGPPLAGAVAVHDDDLGRPGRLRAAHRRVDLLGVQLAPLLVHRLAACGLLRLDDPDALHVADDVHLHTVSLSARGHGPLRQGRTRHRRFGRDRRRLRPRVRGRARTSRAPLPPRRGAPASSRPHLDGGTGAPRRPGLDEPGGRAPFRGASHRTRPDRGLRGGRGRVAVRGRAGLAAAARALGADAAPEPDRDVPHRVGVLARGRTKRPRSPVLAYRRRAWSARGLHRLRGGRSRPSSAASSSA